MENGSGITPVMPMGNGSFGGDSFMVTVLEVGTATET